MDIFLYLLVVGYLMFTIYAANMAEREAWEESVIRYSLYGVVVIIFLMAFFASQAVLLGMLDSSQLPDDMAPLPQIDSISAILTTLFALVAGTFSLRMINSSEARQGLGNLVLRNTGYDAQSHVHTTAILLCTLLVTGLIVFFMLDGGATGVADNLEGTGVSASDTLLTMTLWLLASFLGVGYTIRRYLPSTLDRLGLKAPTSRDVSVGVGVGIGLWVMSIIFGLLWQMLVSPEVFEQQNLAAEQLTLAINSIFLAFIVSFAAAVGEEIFIRGALQPIFGIWVTSAFFALLHTQYLFAPSMFFIFGVSVILGVLRERMSTTTAIIAHFVYNFVPLALVVVTANQVPVS